MAAQAQAAPPQRRVLRDRRDLVLSNVFVTVQLVEKVSKTNPLDKTKLKWIVRNTRKLGGDKPVTAAWLDNPRDREEGCLVMQGTYAEKELAADGLGNPVRCRFASHAACTAFRLEVPLARSLLTCAVRPLGAISRKCFRALCCAESECSSQKS